MIRIINLKNGCILTPVEGLPGQYWYGINGRLTNIITRRTAEQMLEPARSYVLAGMDELDSHYQDKPEEENVQTMKEELKPSRTLGLIINRLKERINHG